MAYAGRTNQEPEILNMGGLNLKATQVNIKDGEAQDIDNMDIDLSGAITVRKGYESLSSISGNVEYFNNYFTSEGQEVFVAIVSHKFYESTSINGPWTDRTGSLVLTGATWQGSYCANSFIFSNGVEQPMISRYGWDLQLLEYASLVIPPTAVTGVAVGGGVGTTYYYVVTSISGRGESLASEVVSVANNGTLSASMYNQLSWTASDGAQSYYVYRYEAGTYNFIYETTSSSYSDQGAVSSLTVHPPSVTTAYNTPNDWNINGSPEGFAVLSRGRNQHLMAWRKSNIWVAAYGSYSDWFTVNDAFAFQVQGGEDNSVNAVVTLYDFTVFFSATNTFVYTGSSSADITQNKILHTGCVSPYSVVLVGDDIYIWTQFGPTTLSRILQGADIQLVPMSVKVAPLVFDQTNRSNWSLISGWHDIRRQRVCWAYPNSGSDSNDGVLVFNYSVPQPDGTKGAWTKYSDWNVVNALLSSSTSNVYGALSNGTLAHLHTTDTDNGTDISWSYKSAWFDLRTWIKKRLLWLDLLMDSTIDYLVNVKLSWEFNRIGWNETHVVNNSATDNYDIQTMGDLNQHRVYVAGNARYFQFVFSGVGPAKIVGFRPDARVKGIR